MSLLVKFLPNFLNYPVTSALKITQTSSYFHSLTSSTLKGPQGINSGNSGSLFNQATRSIIRCHFPRPSERKRVKRHGWNKRMSTPEGRRVLMNRILKGRWIYSH